MVSIKSQLYFGHVLFRSSINKITTNNRVYLNKLIHSTKVQIYVLDFLFLKQTKPTYIYCLYILRIKTNVFNLWHFLIK